MSFFNTFFKSKSVQMDKLEVLEKNLFADAISNKRVQLVDVRTPKEFNAGHIKNALNIDLFSIRDFTNSFQKLNKEEPVYIYCQSGMRSRKAAKRLINMGFSKIYDLKGGYQNWY